MIVSMWASSWLAKEHKQPTPLSGDTHTPNERCLCLKALIEFPRTPCVNFRECPKGEVRSILLLRTRVSRLSSDEPQARELRILYDTQLPQVDVRCSRVLCILRHRILQRPDDK